MYIPTTGSKFPNSPYAIPWGMCIIATVMPAIISGIKSDFKLYSGNHDKIGIKLFKTRNMLQLLKFFVADDKTVI